jgi:transposase
MRNEIVMEGNPLLPLPEGMQIEQMQASENEVRVVVIATHPTSCCPLCRQPSCSIHSRYQRTVRDVPCGGRRIQLLLTVRKFFCRNRLCERKIFTERLPDLVNSWARMTIRLSEQLTSIGLATCGKGGTRLAARLGMQSTRSTILRRIMALPDPSYPSVVQLGIDDFAFRRRLWFGTILVDLERHRVVDLLPDRRAETAARWMRERPDIAAVSRDRGGEYASAASQAVPWAVQVADKFHLAKNLTEATQLLLARCQAEVLAASQAGEVGQSEPHEPIREWRPLEPAQVEKARLARRSGRLARYQEMEKLQQMGKKPKEIAKLLGLSQRTIEKWVAAGTFPEAKRRRKKPSCFDAFAPIVLKRWNEGERSGAKLFQELKEQGFRGSERTVYRYLETLKHSEIQAAPHSHRLPQYSANTAVWLFVRDLDSLDEVEREDVAALREASGVLDQAYRLVQDFLLMLRKREGHRLERWLARVAKSNLPELQQFAHGIERDKAAVQAGLTWEINNAQAEGQITKLKLLKRTMYGRASFPLLRQRVLHAI